MKLIHSLSTRPWRLNVFGYDGMKRLIGSVWYYSLSLAYALRIGAEIELHTDTLGERLLSHLPYSRILTDLDDMPTDISPRFWAAGKMFALDNMSVGDIHIDGDVFIKRRSLLDEMEQADWDAIVQSKEDETWVRACYGRELSAFRDAEAVCAQAGLDLTDLEGAYNTGCVGFRDGNLKSKFAEGYKKIAKAVSDTSEGRLDIRSLATPDLVAEQLYVRQLCDRNGAKVKTLLKEPYSDEPANIGYQHVLTVAKFNEVERVKALLGAVNPQIYAKTKRLCHT